MEEPIKFFGMHVDILAIILSVVAILFTALKDFILPWFIRPNLVFTFEDRRPFRRDRVNLKRTPGLMGTFWRFSVRNIGKSSALNCRCQIERVLRNGESYNDYAGYPLRWASRPESVINQIEAERLNIALGETEFIDLGAAVNNAPVFVLQKYHNVDIGMPDFLEPGRLDIFLIFSGDNFNPYRLHFRMNKEDSNEPDHAEVQLVSVRNI